MTQKQTFTNILLGAIVLAVANTFIYNQQPGLFQAAAGFIVLNFVILLFLTSFVPSRVRKPKSNYKKRQATTAHSSGKKPHASTFQSAPDGSDTRTSARVKSNKNSHTSRQPENILSEADPSPNIQDDETHQGTIKWYDKRKGFGFLLYGNNEIFFHRNAIKSPSHLLVENTQVSFVIGDSPKGNQALYVQIIENK